MISITPCGCCCALTSLLRRTVVRNRRRLFVLAVLSFLVGVLLLLYVIDSSDRQPNATRPRYDEGDVSISDNEEYDTGPGRQSEGVLLDAASGRGRRRRFCRDPNAPTPRWKASYFEGDVGGKTAPYYFQLWTGTKQAYCSGRFIGFDHEFALLLDVQLDRDRCPSARKGGEAVVDVLDQAESAEYYAMRRGCFRLPCRRAPRYMFYNEANHLRMWMNATVGDGTNPKAAKSDADENTFDGFTVAVTRYEYANLYHTMTDWYNVFLMMQFFGASPAETNVLVVDAHPRGALDSVWPQLFNSTFRLSSLPPRTRFRRLVWSILGYESPMKIGVSEDDPDPPLYDEFRAFFLDSHAVDSSERVINCTHPSIRFVLRRDYVAHPRNPSGRVARKIRNEASLLRHLRRSHPDFDFRASQVDVLPMRDQLRFVVDADVLVGVHGAGLTHALFLPTGAGLVEISPNLVWYSQGHFDTIATYRRLVYRRWLNTDSRLEHEADGSVTVPPSVVDALLMQVLRRMCSKSSRADHRGESGGLYGADEHFVDLDYKQRW